jgi:hypothetical protein
MQLLAYFDPFHVFFIVEKSRIIGFKCSEITKYVPCIDIFKCEIKIDQKGPCF